MVTGIYRNLSLNSVSIRFALKAHMLQLQGTPLQEKYHTESEPICKLYQQQVLLAFGIIWIHDDQHRPIRIYSAY
jgi:hypothetical protein